MDECIFYEKLQDAEFYKQRLELALKTANICVFEVDLKQQLYTHFENAEGIFGVPEEKILEDVRPFSRLSPQEYQEKVSSYFSHPEDIAVIDRAFRSIFAGKETTYRARMRAGGSDYIWCKLDVAPIMENGEPVRMVGTITNISDIFSKMKKLEKETQIDGFTGLHNKRHSVELIQKAIHDAPEQRHALIIVDIDQFKSFNDTYGHAIGDEIIATVAALLKNSFRETDLVGRFGGDEFILFVQDIPDNDWLENRLLTLLKCQSGSHEFTNSIGVSLYPDDGKDFEMLFKKADCALYESKKERMSYSFFKGEKRPRGFVLEKTK